MFDEDITIEKQAEYEAELKKRAMISGAVMVALRMAVIFFGLWCGRRFLCLSITALVICIIGKKSGRFLGATADIFMSLKAVILLVDMKYPEYTLLLTAMLVTGLVSSIVMVKSRFTESWFEYRKAALRKHS
ncbi:hypothetical protein [uncultured Ruminococcus sp.]|jgi:hypothetical protein|uniref:hypothetical protein n=1 Tax=uncultured Ruminococcus sp. TaxID=165186 RepID=UPI0025E7621D|nr:hypothetical protein [uncultured Ruminococcus sp.]